VPNTKDTVIKTESVMDIVTSTMMIMITEEVVLKIEATVTMIRKGKAANMLIVMVTKIRKRKAAEENTMVILNTEDTVMMIKIVENTKMMAQKNMRAVRKTNLTMIPAAIHTPSSTSTVTQFITTITTMGIVDRTFPANILTLLSMSTEIPFTTMTITTMAIITIIPAAIHTPT